MKRFRTAFLLLLVLGLLAVPAFAQTATPLPTMAPFASGDAALTAVTSGFQGLGVMAWIGVIIVVVLMGAVFAGVIRGAKKAR